MKSGDIVRHLAKDGTGIGKYYYVDSVIGNVAICNFIQDGIIHKNHVLTMSKKHLYVCKQVRCITFSDIIEKVKTLDTSAFRLPYKKSTNKMCEEHCDVIKLYYRDVYVYARYEQAKRIVRRNDIEDICRVLLTGVEKV